MRPENRRAELSGGLRLFQTFLILDAKAEEEGISFQGPFMNGFLLRAHTRSRLGTREAGQRSFRPRMEQLEDRSMLSAFASIHGDISTPGEKDTLPIHIDAADISLHRWG